MPQTADYFQKHCIFEKHNTLTKTRKCVNACRGFHRV